MPAASINLDAWCDKWPLSSGYPALTVPFIQGDYLYATGRCDACSATGHVREEHRIKIGDHLIAAPFYRLVAALQNPRLRCGTAGRTGRGNDDRQFLNK
jgi:hypothetical protein